MEAEASARRVCPHNSVRHTHLRVVNFNTWLCDAYPGEGVESPLPKPGSWMQLVGIIQYMWSTR